MDKCKRYSRIADSTYDRAAGYCGPPLFASQLPTTAGRRFSATGATRLRFCVTSDVRHIRRRRSVFLASNSALDSTPESRNWASAAICSGILLL